MLCGLFKMSLKERLSVILLPILESGTVELVDLEIKGKRNNQTIKVFVDKEGGIHLRECESISRRFADELEFEDDMPDRYRIEVSSPGLDRPLLKARDFTRNLNREVRVTYHDEQGESTFQGQVVRVYEDVVEIQGERERRSFPISKIKFGKIMLPW